MPFPRIEQHTVKHRLDPARIVETAEDLAREIGEQLPASSLAGLAVSLAAIARATDERAAQLRKPIYAIRAGSVIAIAVGCLLLFLVGRHIHTRWEFGTIGEVFEATDAGFNLVVILTGALWFFITLEGRIKRRRTLESIEELREFIHVIDVTQLYFTPELYKSDGQSAHTTLKLDHTYLLLCSRMLAVIGNLAALYSRGAAGDSIIRAVFEVELLANSITAKLHSKAQAVREATAPG